ncbi:MAG: hypothetical protein H9535_00420 [Ignavibacteria bacterium]|nr:hypothetical protein [Ignavibacteria bacterium]
MKTLATSRLAEQEISNYYPQMRGFAKILDNFILPDPNYNRLRQPKQIQKIFILPLQFIVETRNTRLCKNYFTIRSTQKAYSFISFFSNNLPTLQK